MERYRAYYGLVKAGAVLSTHNVSEGGLAVTLAEMTFSGKAGVRIAVDQVPVEAGTTTAELLFGETPGRLVVEIAPEHIEAAAAAGVVFIGETTGEPWVHLLQNGTTLIDSSVSDLKTLWKSGLKKFY